MVVLMTASVEAIFEAMERSLAMNTAMHRVSATAKRRHMMACMGVSGVGGGDSSERDGLLVKIELRGCERAERRGEIDD